MIPYGKQNITEEDIQAVVNVLRSEYLTQGPAVQKFEQALCDFTNAKYATAVNSGTSALHLACLALGLSNGDWLWTSSITFVASANCGLYCGANVDFIDIDPLNWNLSISSLEEKLKNAEENNCLPKVLVAVHLCGLPCEMSKIKQLSKQYSFYVIEDACHAIGGQYHNEKIGNCKYSDITIFSFHPVKTITTAEGGAATTNNANLHEKMSLLRSHGISRNQDQMTKNMEGAWYYQQLELGYNYRLNDIQAALGISQLERLININKKRKKLVANYDNQLQNLPLKLQNRSDKSESGNHLYVIRVSQKIHTELFDGMRMKGIGVNLHYIPIYQHPYYKRVERDENYSVKHYPEAEQYYKEAITLPLYPELQEEDQQYVIEQLENMVKKIIC